MKKMFLTVTSLILVCTSCFAVGAGFGVRHIGMGGTGIATVNDTASAYFNPAGILSGVENFEFSGNLGGSATGLSEIAAALASPDFIHDYFDKDLIANGNMRGALCFSLKKVGFGLITDGFGTFNKPANSTTLDYDVTMTETFPITVGSTFSTPWLPNVAFGVNIKPIAQQSAVANISAPSTTEAGTGNTDITIGSGFGFDVGAQAQITPIITGGIVIRNLASSINSNIERSPMTIYPTGTTETGTKTKSTASSSLPTEIGIGVAGIVPSTGTILAGDVEYYSQSDKSYTDIHIGAEQKLMFNLLAFRIGYFTYGPLSDSFFTYGVGMTATGFDFGFAASNSTKATGNSSAVIEIGSSF